MPESVRRPPAGLRNTIKRNLAESGLRGRFLYESPLPDLDNALPPAIRVSDLGAPFAYMAPSRRRDRRPRSVTRVGASVCKIIAGADPTRQYIRVAKGVVRLAFVVSGRMAVGAKSHRSGCASSLGLGDIARPDAIRTFGSGFPRRSADSPRKSDKHRVSSDRGETPDK